MGLSFSLEKIMSYYYFDENDVTMAGLRQRALEHCLSSMKEAYKSDSFLSKFHTEVPLSWSHAPLNMTCSSFYENSGCCISEASNILINLRFPAESGAYFIDLFKDEVSFGVCGNSDISFRNFTVLKDLDMLQSDDEEVLFQYKTLYDTLDLSVDEISIIMQIVNLIRVYR